MAYGDLVTHAGNEELQRALEWSLLACLRGHTLHVHVEGLRGTGKTTVMRAAAGLLGGIRRIPGCPYNCDPDRPHCPLHRSLSRADLQRLGSEWVEAPFLEIAASAKIGTVVGSIDLARLTSPERAEAALLPGTLARAHRGIVFVDEINRLADCSPELADALLDVMGTKPGRLQIEEAGLPPVVLPCRATVWAASNPDEEPGPLADIRRQLADRFDLAVAMRRPAEPAAVFAVLADNDTRDEDAAREARPCPVVPAGAIVGVAGSAAGVAGSAAGSAGSAADGGNTPPRAAPQRGCSGAPATGPGARTAAAAGRSASDAARTAPGGPLPMAPASASAPALGGPISSASAPAPAPAPGVAAAPPDVPVPPTAPMAAAFAPFGGADARTQALRASLHAGTALPAPAFDDDLRMLLARTYCDFQLESLRAVLAWQVAARLSALRAGRQRVSLSDLAVVAPSVLRHRLDPDALAHLLQSLGGTPADSPGAALAGVGVVSRSGLPVAGVPPRAADPWRAASAGLCPSITPAGPRASGLAADGGGAVASPATAGTAGSAAWGRGRGSAAPEPDAPLGAGGGGGRSGTAGSPEGGVAGSPDPSSARPPASGARPGESPSRPSPLLRLLRWAGLAADPLPPAVSGAGLAATAGAPVDWGDLGCEGGPTRLADPTRLPPLSPRCPARLLSDLPAAELWTPATPAGANPPRLTPAPAVRLAPAPASPGLAPDPAPPFPVSPAPASPPVPPPSASSPAFPASPFPAPSPVPPPPVAPPPPPPPPGKGWCD